MIKDLRKMSVGVFFFRCSLHHSGNINLIIQALGKGWLEVEMRYGRRWRLCAAHKIETQFCQQEHSTATVAGISAQSLPYQKI